MAVALKAVALHHAVYRPAPWRVCGRYVDWDRVERELVLSFRRHSNLPFFRGLDTTGLRCLQGV